MKALYFHSLNGKKFYFKWLSQSIFVLSEEIRKTSVCVKHKGNCADVFCDIYHKQARLNWEVLDSKIPVDK